MIMGDHSLQSLSTYLVFRGVSMTIQLLYCSLLYSCSSGLWLGDGRVSDAIAHT